MKNTIESTLQKRVYCSPQIERIQLDNEISLALESTPPSFEGSNRLNQGQEYFDNSPLKSFA